MFRRLPRVEAAFLAGRITWTMAQLPGRVVTSEDETAWLAVALGSSAAQLARRVREVDCLEAQALDAFAIATDEGAAWWMPAWLALRRR